MNKRIVPILLVLLVIMLVTGCSRKNEPSETTEETQLDTAVVETMNVTEGPVSELTEEEIEAIFGNPEETTVSAEETTAPTEGTSSNSTTTPTKKPSTGSNNSNKSDSSTKETKPKETEPEETTAPTTETKPQETKPQETKPEENEPEVVLSDYERYMAMSGQEQMEFMESFSSVEAFFSWYNDAKAEYDAAHPDFEIGNGKIDLDDIPLG